MNIKSQVEKRRKPHGTKLLSKSENAITCTSDEWMEGLNTPKYTIHHKYTMNYPPIGENE